jgi:hypothetical protein
MRITIVMILYSVNQNVTTVYNYGHKVTDYRLKNYNPDMKSTVENVKVWKKKVDDNCGLVLSSQRKKNPWYIDSGCSKHMTGDRSKFLTLSDSK